jgi:hypothetical protein
MSDNLRVTAVEALDGHLIRAAFSDGAVMEIDLSDLLSRGEVFGLIRKSRSEFEAVHVNPDTGTVEWPGEVDLDAEVLYGRFEPASGAAIHRRTVHGPAIG